MATFIQNNTRMADPELNRAEDSMKAKYIPLIRNMSHVELKKFNKDEYKKKVMRDMSKMLPSYQTTEFDGYAQCVSNALQNEVKSLLNSRVRMHSASEAAEPPDISETFLGALDLTMHADIFDTSKEPLSQVSLDADDENDNGDEAGDDNEAECDEGTDCENESLPNASVIHLDDSITKLKETIDTESAHCVQPDKTNNGKGDHLKTESHKCCDSCSIKPKTKKKFDMIQCSACMSWFHEKCVGLDNSSEPIGIWLCLTCRKFPQTITTELSDLKTELSELKQSTHSILTAVTRLTTNIERSIGNINDRITALNN